MLLAGQASGTPGFLSLYPTKEVLRGWVKVSGLRFFFFFFSRALQNPAHTYGGSAWLE